MNVILNLFLINLRQPYGMPLAITPMMMPFSLLNDFLQRVGKIIINLSFLWAKSFSIKVGLAVIIYQSQFDKVRC